MKISPNSYVQNQNVLVIMKVLMGFSHIAIIVLSQLSSQLLIWVGEITSHLKNEQENQRKLVLCPKTHSYQHFSWCTHLVVLFHDPALLTVMPYSPNQKKSEKMHRKSSHDQSTTHLNLSYSLYYYLQRLIIKV